MRIEISFLFLAWDSNSIASSWKNLVEVRNFHQKFTMGMVFLSSNWDSFFGKFFHLGRIFSLWKNFRSILSCGISSRLWNGRFWSFYQLVFWRNLSCFFVLVEFGEEKPRTILSGLVKHYSLEQMKVRVYCFYCPYFWKNLSQVFFGISWSLSYLKGFRWQFVFWTYLGGPIN